MSVQKARAVLNKSAAALKDKNVKLSKFQGEMFVKKYHDKLGGMLSQDQVAWKTVIAEIAA